MRNSEFAFVDGWRIFSSKGNYIYITESDLINYAENGLSEDDIKSISYSYLTSDSFMDFTLPNYQSYEF
jgi:hypothetical protein